MLLQNEVAATSAPVAISGLAAGIYSVEVRLGSNVSETVKLLKK